MITLEAYLGPCETCMMEHFYKYREQLLAVHYFRKKAPS